MSIRRDIASYFKAGKRVLSSSSDSDTGSPVGCTPQRKRVNVDSSDFEDTMAVQEALDKITKRLDALATKDDISIIRGELKDLTNTFLKKVEQLEARVFDVEARTDRQEREVNAVKKKNEELQNALRHQELRIKENDREINDLQQYSRRSNVRVFRVPEAERETAEDCVKKGGYHLQ